MADPTDGIYERLNAAAAALGMACRGGFRVEPGEELPEVDAGRPGRTLLLLGFTGAIQWPAFTASPEFVDGQPHPLDRWSVRIISQLATDFGARPLYPFGGPPWWPFQQWAQRAEALHRSPLGILIHPRFGLWHAYRGALLFGEVFAVPPRMSWPSPCESCATKPCIASCPAGAVTASGFHRAACAAHLASPQGIACRKGCLSRASCPVATSHRYGAQQAAFHMQALLESPECARQPDSEGEQEP
ncbi:MAG TPA: hypothetical protein VMT66_18200 [Steroidobacteraceae bacterium]|nr:hypothetical protein [Steroidobacteraceae bacterium]